MQFFFFFSQNLIAFLTLVFLCISFVLLLAKINLLTYLKFFWFSSSCSWFFNYFININFIFSFLFSCFDFFFSDFGDFISVLISAFYFSFSFVFCFCPWNKNLCFFRFFWCWFISSTLSSIFLFLIFLFLFPSTSLPPITIIFFSSPFPM